MNEKTPNRTFPFHSQKCEKEREKRNERVKKVIKTILGQQESGKRQKGD